MYHSWIRHWGKKKIFFICNNYLKFKQDNKTATLDIVTEDYTSESFFPFDASTSNQPLIHGFISSNRFNDFIKTYKLNILQRLIPGLNKPGYEDESNR